MSGGPHLQMPREAPSEPSAPTATQILRQRAAALRKKPEAPQESVAQSEVVEFAVGAERYGIDATLARDVQLLREITPLPGLPPHVVGIIAVRGQVVPLIDLRRLFDLPDAPAELRPCVLILGSGDSSVGVLADQVIGVRQIRSAEIQPMPSMGVKQVELFSGITADRMAILRGERLLSDSGS